MPFSAPQPLPIPVPPSSPEISESTLAPHHRFPPGDVINGFDLRGYCGSSGRPGRCSDRFHLSQCAFHQQETLRDKTSVASFLPPGSTPTRPPQSCLEALSRSTLKISMAQRSSFKLVAPLPQRAGSSVLVENLGTNDNVYYAVGSSATLGTNSTFLGDILAEDSVALTTGANITCGSAIALTGAVTLDTNNITNCSASGSDVSSTIDTVVNGPPTVTPEPGAFVLLSTGLLAGAGAFRRRFFA